MKHNIKAVMALYRRLWMIIQYQYQMKDIRVLQ